MLRHEQATRGTPERWSLCDTQPAPEPGQRPCPRIYGAFAPAEARQIVERLENHYTPKHGSWLNIAEIELSTMSGLCLSRHIADAIRSNVK